MRGLDESKTFAGHALTIEKFDDIAFEDDGRPVELIQTKHHCKPGDTSDKSVDVWKTLAIWIGRVKGDPSAVAEARFVFLTTSQAAPNSALSKLRAERKRSRRGRSDCAVAAGGKRIQKRPNKEGANGLPHDGPLNTAASGPKHLVVGQFEIVSH